MLEICHISKGLWAVIILRLNLAPLCTGV